MSTPELKGATTALVENQVALLNSYGVCMFHWMLDPAGYTPQEYYGKAYAAATGIDRTPKELMRDGERICNLEKAINSRIGMRREHDTICERWMWEPTDEGMYPGSVAANVFEEVLDEYYDWRGWERQTGLQTRAKLESLDLGDVAEVLAKDGALASCCLLYTSDAADE